MCKYAVCGSSPLLSFMSLQSHSGLAAGAALPRSSLLIPFTAFAEGCLHLCVSSSTAHHPREHTVPRAETFLTMRFQRGALLLHLVPPEYQQKEQPTPSCSRQWLLLETFPSTSTALRNNIHLHEALPNRAGWLSNEPSGVLQKSILLKVLSQFILFFAACYAGEETALVIWQMSTAPLLLLEAKRHRHCSQGCTQR